MEEDYEAIRQAHYIEKKSIRQIAREQHHSRRTIRKALQQVYPQPYLRTVPQPAPIFGAFRHRVDEVLAKNETLPPKQRYTTHTIYEVLFRQRQEDRDRLRACHTEHEGVGIPASWELRSRSLCSHVYP